MLFSRKHKERCLCKSCLEGRLYEWGDQAVKKVAGLSFRIVDLARPAVNQQPGPVTPWYWPNKRVMDVHNAYCQMPKELRTIMDHKYGDRFDDRDCMAFCNVPKKLFYKRLKELKHNIRKLMGG